MAMPAAVAAALRGLSASAPRASAAAPQWAQQAGRLLLWDLKREGHAAGSGWSQATNRIYSYTANAATRNAMADPEAALQAYWRGDIKADTCDWVLAWNGLPSAIQSQGLNSNYTSNHRVWWSHYKNSRPDWEIDKYVELWLRRQAMGNPIDDAAMAAKLKRHGITGDRADLLFNWASSIYDIDQIVQMYWRGWISAQRAHDWLQALGYRREEIRANILEIRPQLEPSVNWLSWAWGNLPDQQTVIDKVQSLGYTAEDASLMVQAMRAAPTPDETRVLLNRDLITEAQARLYLSVNGFVGNEQDHQVLLKNELPGASDLVRFAVREVWNPQAIADFGYDQEFPEPVRFFLRKQGFGIGDPVPDPANPGNFFPATDWAMAWWIAHWEIPSPTQVYEMFQRVRPDNIQDWWALGFGARVDPQTGAQIPAMPPVTLSTVREVLKVHDYAPFVRDWMAAISFRELDQRMGKLLLKQGIGNHLRSVKILRNRGYKLNDAEDVATAWDFELTAAAEKPDLARLKKWNDCMAGEVLKQYGLGIANAQVTIDKLKDLGWREDGIMAAMACIIYKQNTVFVAALLKRTRDQYCCGEITIRDAFTAMVQYGIDPEMAGRHVSSWVCKYTCQHRSLTVAQIMASVAACQLDVNVARDRLLNLGYTNVDAMLLVAQAQAKCQGVLAQQAAAAQKRWDSYAKLLAQLLKDYQAILGEPGASLQETAYIQLVDLLVIAVTRETGAVTR